LINRKREIALTYSPGFPLVLLVLVIPEKKKIIYKLILLETLGN
jgi:hypothetical protein